MQTAECFAIVDLARAVAIGAIEIVQSKLNRANDNVGGVNARGRKLQGTLTAQTKRDNHASVSYTHLDVYKRQLP